MANYEPELMYALDSKSEYADWKNVYNVSGSDVLYCPICLGRVKLWNGQDPERTYKKQKCFHHIDGMCSQESRIHFAYKTWLLKAGSKIKVGEKTYDVVNAEIEKILHTSYGDYRPDIIVDTSDNKKFFVEIAHTNKKTEDYVLKWDELGCTVLELDVNEQLLTAKIDGVPEFKVIYSSITGKCYIKQYIHSEYDNMITERKVFWKRNELMNYKLQWEKLDQFWRKLQIFYAGKSDIGSVVDAFKEMEPSDQRFVCSKMRGKHSIVKYELENNYTNIDDWRKANIKHIGKVIRELNKQFGLSSNEGRPYLCRNYGQVEFKVRGEYYASRRLKITDEITPDEVKEYFQSCIKEYLDGMDSGWEEKLKQKKIHEQDRLKIRQKYENVFKYYADLINNSKNGLWRFHYYLNPQNNYHGKIYLFGYCKDFYLETNFDVEDLQLILKCIFTDKMHELIEYLKTSTNDIRIMEDK